jgi:hypothetical protein
VSPNRFNLTIFVCQRILKSKQWLKSAINFHTPFPAAVIADAITMNTRVYDEFG